MPSPKDYSPFVPFDLYDFFGYIFPGVLFATSMAFFLWVVDPKGAEFMLTMAFSQKTDTPFLLGLGLVVAGIVVLYALGHFLALTSYIIIDRVLVDGIEGYPSTWLLNLTRVVRPYSECTYKYLFALFNLVLLTPVILSDTVQIRSVLELLLACIALLIFQRIVVMVFHKSVPDGRARAARLGRTWPFKAFLLPAHLIDIVIDFLRKLLGLDRRFPEKFISLYKARFEQRFSPLTIAEAGSDNYWLSAFYASSHNAEHERTLHTWLHLYGFARNAAAAFYLAASLIVAHLWWNPEVHNTLFRIYLFTLIVLASGLGLRYWVLYSKYYSKGVFRAFVDGTTPHS